MPSALASPFKAFNIIPFYGGREAVIEWSLQSGLTGNVYFYRSLTGTGEWELLNPDTPSTVTSGEFLDLTVDINDPFTIPKYRGVLDPSGGGPETWLSGPMVSALDRITRKEYFLTREIMRKQYRSFSGPKGNGVRCFHLVPKTAGDPTRTYDPETGQHYGADCPNDPDSGFGTPWQGGFHSPLQTWVWLFDIPSVREEDRQDLTGVDRSEEANMQLLAYPKPEPGHLIVLPDSDRRYVIDAPIKPYKLRSSVPLYWEAKALLLERNDPRCRIRMPALQLDPRWVMEYRKD